MEASLYISKGWLACFSKNVEQGQENIYAEFLHNKKFFHSYNRFHFSFFPESMVKKTFLKSKYVIISNHNKVMYYSCLYFARKNTKIIFLIVCRKGFPAQ